MKKLITPFQARPESDAETAARAWAKAFHDAIAARKLPWYDPEAVDDDAAGAFKLIGATTSPEEAARVYCDEPDTPWVDQVRGMPGTNFA